MYDLDSTDGGLPAVIPIDINISRMGGFSLMAKIEEIGHYNDSKNPSTIVMLSIADFANDVEQASKIGQVKRFITKPLTPLKLETLHTLYFEHNRKAA